MAGGHRGVGDGTGLEVAEDVLVGVAVGVADCDSTEPDRATSKYSHRPKRASCILSLVEQHNMSVVERKCNSLRNL
jgi:hypothetical protein